MGIFSCYDARVQLCDRSKTLEWTLDVLNYFFVATDRSFLDSGSLPNGGCETIWNNWILIKLNILIWCINLICIPTRERLSSKGIMVESILCLICSRPIKSMDHLFVGCLELLELWSRIAILWGVQIPTHLYM